MKKILLKSLLLLILIIPSMNSNAQEQEEDSLLRVIEKLQSDVSVLKRLKISGYLQAQYQLAETPGESTVAGGSFPKDVDQRFMVRRGRIKFGYTGKLSSYVLQFDASEGGFTLKDFYLKFTDPWTNAFSFTGGIFNRNFGYEIEYSSSVREAPERARIFQTLFPGEEDLGACLTFQPRKTSPYNFMKFDIGVFNGTGTKNKDFDNKKDLIARLTLNKSFLSDQLKVVVGGSYNYGSMLNFTNAATNSQYVWEIKNGSYVKDSSKYSNRIFNGLETQITYLAPFGLTQFRAEYLWGQQPGTNKNSNTPSVLNTGDTYLRNFSGYYFIISQNIAQSPFQLVARYDVYDPNTKISGNEIGTGTGTNAADIKYSTVGLGLIYRFDSNIKITAYYDMVKNESTALNGYTSDLKDNLFTLRIQYKF